MKINFTCSNNFKWSPLKYTILQVQWSLVKSKICICYDFLSWYRQPLKRHRHRFYTNREKCIFKNTPFDKLNCDNRSNIFNIRAAFVYSCNLFFLFYKAVQSAGTVCEELYQGRGTHKSNWGGCLHLPVWQAQQSGEKFSSVMLSMNFGLERFTNTELTVCFVCTRKHTLLLWLTSLVSWYQNKMMISYWLL